MLNFRLAKWDVKYVLSIIEWNGVLNVFPFHNLYHCIPTYKVPFTLEKINLTVRFVLLCALRFLVCFINLVASSEGLAHIILSTRWKEQQIQFTISLPGEDNAVFSFDSEKNHNRVISVQVDGWCCSIIREIHEFFIGKMNGKLKSLPFQRVYTVCLFAWIVLLWVLRPLVRFYLFVMIFFLFFF